MTISYYAKTIPDFSTGTRGWNFHWSSSGSKVNLFIILFFSSGGMKFSMIRYLHGQNTQQSRLGVMSHHRLVGYTDNGVKIQQEAVRLVAIFTFSASLQPLWNEISTSHVFNLPVRDIFVTHLNLSSRVSSFWVCSSSCRLLTCSSFMSLISLLMHWSFAYSWREKDGDRQRQWDRLKKQPFITF